ncbi:hypothetical protein [Pseudoalteromonas sp.]|uniref:hypothetical protein n=1 Tax=Pseudoalteromonas sp. TaxID=53249 RepID=UPI001BCDA73E|nr:hypothetical protein [Pseudoalteromonas sp.]
MKKYALIFMVFLFGCTSSINEPPYEINQKQFYDALDEQGNKLFAYVVSVKAKTREQINLNKKLTRSDIERFAEQEHFEESTVLKLQLEDQAVEFLSKELAQRNYCEDKYKINEVLWRDLSVQLRGRCL